MKEKIKLEMQPSTAFLVLAAMRITHDRMKTSPIPAVRNRAAELAQVVSDLRAELDACTSRAVRDAISIMKEPEDGRQRE